MNKHTATHEGFTFTRNSKGRVYSHAIVVARSLSKDRDHAVQSGKDMWRINRAYYTKLANGQHELAAKYPGQYTEERIADDIASAKAWIASGEEGRIAHAIRFHERRAADIKTAADGDTYYVCEGWAGRHDLARKAAAPFGDKAVIVEAVIK